MLKAKLLHFPEMHRLCNWRYKTVFEVVRWTLEKVVLEGLPAASGLGTTV